MYFICYFVHIRGDAYNMWDVCRKLPAFQQPRGNHDRRTPGPKCYKSQTGSKPFLGWFPYIMLYNHSIINIHWCPNIYIYIYTVYEYYDWDMIQIPLYHFTISFISVSLHLPSFSEVAKRFEYNMAVLILEGLKVLPSVDLRLGALEIERHQCEDSQDAHLQRSASGRFWCFTSHSWGKSNVF